MFTRLSADDRHRRTRLTPLTTLPPRTAPPNRAAVAAPADGELLRWQRLIVAGTWSLITLAALLVLGLAGCSGSDPIRSYEVAKSAAGPKDRMLGAILPKGEQAWFFKLTGPTDAAAAVAEPFAAFVKSIRFEGEQPVWQLPEGWTEEPGNAMRFATIRIATDGEPLEMSVTSLGMPPGDLNGYLLANLNRWRNQLGLPPVDEGQLEEAAPKIEVDGNPVWLVNIEGQMTSSGMGRAPFAGGGGLAPPMAGGAGASPEPPASPGGKLAYEVPDGWQQGEEVSSRGGFSIPREAAFNVTDGEQQAEVTVTRLPARAGGVVPNVNRWRGQVGLEPAEPSEIENELTEIDVDGQPGKMASLIGPEQAILGVIVERDGATWFIKLQGASPLAERERANFESFVRSLRFDG